MSVGYNYAPMGDGRGAPPGSSAPGGGGGYPSMYGSFAFKKRFEQIDWKKIGLSVADVGFLLHVYCYP